MKNRLGFGSVISSGLAYRGIKKKNVINYIITYAKEPGTDLNAVARKESFKALKSSEFAVATAWTYPSPWRATYRICGNCLYFSPLIYLVFLSTESAAFS